MLCAGCAVSNFPLVIPPKQNTKESAAKLRAEEYFIKGRYYDMLGQYKTAVQFYKTAYKLDPSSQTLRTLLVERCMYESQFTQAILLIKGDKKESALSVADRRLLAGVYLRTGQFMRASELLEGIDKKEKEDLFTLGLIYESLGNQQKALQKYSDYLEKNPSSIQMTMKIGALYVRLKRYDAAESLFVAAVRKVGQNAELFNAIGEVKLARGDTALAADFFKMAVMIDSTFQDGLRNMAQLFVQKGDYAKAVPYYERLYGIDTSGELYGKTLSLLYYYANKYQQAETIIRKMLSEDVEDCELHYYLGLCLASQDSLELAKMEFEKSLVLRSTYHDAWLQLCYLLLKQKDMDGALAASERFKKTMPAFGPAWRTVGYVRAIRKEYPEAVAVLKKAVLLDSTDSWTWFELGSSLERTHEAAQAAAAFLRVLSLKPDDAASSNYLGYMWADEGIKLDSAKVLIRQALDHDSSSGAYLDSYAWVFYRLGDADSALEYIKKAILLIKDDPIVYSHYGDILLKKGNDREALEAFKKSISIDPKSDEADKVRQKIQMLESKTEGQSRGKKPQKQ
jgi:tetratricopeptide (TPR) repeat protein